MAHLFIRLEDKQKDEIFEAVNMMNYNNGTKQSVNDVVRRLAIRWARKYNRSEDEKIDNFIEITKK